MVQEVVDAGLVGGERSRLHRRAARLLAEDGARDGVVATHLLAAEPEADPWAAGVLAAAWMEARWERRFGHPRRAEDLARLALELADDQPIPAMADEALAALDRQHAAVSM